MSTKEKRRKYDRGFKLEAVRLSHEPGRSVSGVARLMRVNGIYAKRRQRYRAATNSKHDYPVAPNLLDRQFALGRPNMVWVSDITYIPNNCITSFIRT